MTGFPRVEPLGDSGLIAVLGEGRDPALTRRVATLAALLRRSRMPGVLDVVPAYAALAVLFDASVADPAILDKALLLAARQALAEGPEGAPETERRTHRIPVRYDGPDLAEVAERTGLSAAEVVLRHAGPSYDVFFLGFAPGFAYLGPLDPKLVLPRRGAPRRRVPAGSVGIAGAQTGVYPLETPGGWHLIGLTDATLFDPARDPPNLLAPGDRVRFVPVKP